MELKLGFMASHNGSNVKAILENIENKSLEAIARIVISNNPNAKVLERARNLGILGRCLNNRNFPLKGNYHSLDDAIVGTMKENGVNLIVLAGYMKKIGKGILKKYPNRILNIHPALNLLKYGGEGMYGKRVHESVIASDDQESGATIHLVNEEYDRGRILLQRRVLRNEGDTAETLAKRVLEAEHILYTQVLRDIQRGLIDLDERS